MPPRPLLLALALALASMACHGAHDSHTASKSSAGAAQALLASASGSSVNGTVLFEAVDGGVRITADVQGLAPEGIHGFHIHERGDCSAPDATSAGGHFDPHAAPHGDPDAAVTHRHLGDLGNLVADGTGRAVYERVDPLLSLSGTDSILGLAVIVHAQRDDLATQPTGGAGPRVACGLIGRLR